MHTYQRYRPRSQAEIRGLVQAHPIAVTITALPGQAPTATHAPIVLPPELDPESSLVGAIVRGHMGRANPHWQHFRGQPPVLLVFSTSHAYVTPLNYDPGPTAPTVDYAAVHLTGRVELIDSPSETLDVVRTTVTTFESARRTQWDLNGSSTFFEQILPGVVAFRVHVETQDAIFKLSQEKSAPVRRRVRDDLAQGPHPHPDVVAWLDRFEGPPA